MSISYINPPRKILWHSDQVVKIRNGQKPPPINVEIDLSNRCSLGCEWCHFGYTHTRGPLASKRGKPTGATAGGDLMDYDLAVSMMSQLHEAGVKSLTWTGGGEPTIHPKFNAIIDQCPLPQGIYTHGGHINPERGQLMKRRMDWIYISLDECTAKDYKASKGVDYFDAVCVNTSLLAQQMGGAVIGVGFMIHAGNYHHIPDMVRLGKQLGVDYVQFRPTIRYEQDSQGAAAEHTKWVKDAIRWLKPYKDNDFVHADIERFEMYADWKRPYRTCYWTQIQTVITPNGKIWTCVNKREHAGAELGDLTTQSFVDIWQNSKPHCVDNDCRVMCRGHIPNLTLSEMMIQPIHENFI